jgi:hypothetical protein
MSLPAGDEEYVSGMFSRDDGIERLRAASPLK